jgi:hypothetical protein
VNDTREEFSQRRLEIIAEDLQAFTEMPVEVFGGDLVELTAAMHETVEQIDEHIHDIPSLNPGEEGTSLVQKINDVSVLHFE